MPAPPDDQKNLSIAEQMAEIFLRERSGLYDHDGVDRPADVAGTAMCKVLWFLAHTFVEQYRDADPDVIPDADAWLDSLTDEHRGQRETDDRAD